MAVTYYKRIVMEYGGELYRMADGVEQVTIDGEGIHVLLVENSNMDTLIELGLVTNEKPHCISCRDTGDMIVEYGAPNRTVPCPHCKKGQNHMEEQQ